MGRHKPYDLHNIGSSSQITKKLSFFVLKIVYNKKY